MGSTEVVSRLSVSREVPTPAPRLSQPREVACFSKGRAGVTFDRAGLAVYAAPRLPVDLNVGFDLFQDRDRSEPHPAPLVNLLASLEAHGQEAALTGCRFVTYRGNVAKLLLTPYNERDEWHIEMEKQGDAVFFNVTEPPSSLAQVAADRGNERKRAMQYWGFAFEEACSAGGAGLQLGIDSTEGFNSVAVTRVGQHRLLVASEVDAELPGKQGGRSGGGARVAADMERYVELKTTRLMDNPRQVENFERLKLLRWWAQSFPAGVPRILVGFRDDDGFVHKVQELATAMLPRYVSGKPYAWDADVCVSFLDRALTWLDAQLADATAGQRFRLEYVPREARELRLVRDPAIPPFVAPDAALRTELYAATPAGGGAAREAEPAAEAAEDGGEGKRLRVY
eukprot:jgi/Tetstr1/434366/TSEL_023470.t2